jgi:beta-aspartyl-dipeptidase (metallo-type)
LLDGGSKLADVLPAFTSNPARLLRLKRKGRIAPGADADLVVLGSDNAIESVMARGEWHVRAGRALVIGKFEKEFPGG